MLARSSQFRRLMSIGSAMQSPEAVEPAVKRDRLQPYRRRSAPSKPRPPDIHPASHHLGGTAMVPALD
jgi:hypothetical protein